MKPYDKKNNDTYVEKYSNSLQGDVEAHMFKDNNAMTVHFGNIRGHFSVESAIVARNNVLHFEPAKDLGLRLLKTLDLQTLVPYSLMKRYSMGFLSNNYTQKTPIYFNLESEKFILSMDNRVMRDMKEYPKFKEELDILVKSGDISFVEVGSDSQLLLNYNSIEELTKDKTGLYKKVKEIYESVLIDLYPTEDVIIVFTSFKNNKENISEISNQNFAKSNDLNHEFNNCSINFEYIKAKKINTKNFYLYDKNDKLLKDKTYHVDKDRVWKEFDSNESLNKIVFLGLPHKVLVMPYTKLDWDLLVGLKKKMDSIFTDLDAILMTQKKVDGLDGSLQDIKLSEHILLKNESKQLRLK